MLPQTTSPKLYKMAENMGEKLFLKSADGTETQNREMETLVQLLLPSIKHQGYT